MTSKIVYDKIKGLHNPELEAFEKAEKNYKEAQKELYDAQSECEKSKSDESYKRLRNAKLKFDKTRKIWEDCLEEFSAKEIKS